ncbi:MAG: hypothetical protein U9R42_03805 [Bacteroidota bacterium]|nr:hypothetical protein [Bacteroidota bacterium]
MKRINLLLGIAITAVMFLTSCGGGSVNIDGGVLGDLPTIAAKTVNKLKGLVEDYKKAESSGDAEKYAKLKQEIETVKEQAKTEMNTYIQSKENFTIPFEQKLDNELFTIKEVKLVPKSHFQTRESLKSSLVLEVTCVTVKDFKGNSSLFLRFVSSEGEILEGYATLNYFGKALKTLAPGEEIVFKGSYTGNVQNLIKVANVINISRDEWNELKKNK